MRIGKGASLECGDLSPLYSDLNVPCARCLWYCSFEVFESVSSTFLQNSGQKRRQVAALQGDALSHGVNCSRRLEEMRNYAPRTRIRVLLTLPRHLYRNAATKSPASRQVRPTIHGLIVQHCNDLRHQRLLKRIARQVVRDAVASNISSIAPARPLFLTSSNH